MSPYKLKSAAVATVKLLKTVFPSPWIPAEFPVNIKVDVNPFRVPLFVKSPAIEWFNADPPLWLKMRWAETGVALQMLL